MASIRTSDARTGRESPTPQSLTWEALLPELSTSERSLLPGLLDAVCLPLVAPETSGPVPTPPFDPAELLRQWLAGSTSQAVRGEISCDPIDSPVADDRINSAVFQARHTPDGYLIRGAGGTGKTAAIRQIIEPVRRVLVLGGTVSATVELLRDIPPVLALRAVRTAGTRSDTVRDWTGWTQNLAEIVGERIDTGIARFEADRRNGEAEMLGIERLLVLPGELQTLGAARTEAASRLPAVRADLERELAGSIETPAVRERIDRAVEHASDLEAETARLEAVSVEMADLQTEAQTLEQKHHQLEPLHVACENARWWSGDFWKAKLDKTRLEGFATLCERRNAVRVRLGELQLLKQEAEVAIGEAPSRLRRWNDRHFGAEIARRTAALRTTIDAADLRIPALNDELERLNSERIGRGERPGPFPPEDGERLRTSVAVAISQNRQSIRLLQQFREASIGREAQLIAWLRNGLRLVVGSVDAVASDPYLSDPACPRFDRLLIDEAADLSEAQFLSLARRADRWTMTSACSLPPVEGDPRRAGPFRRNDLFARLWSVLHKPAWSREGGRWLCRLERIVGDDRRFLEAEPLADNPETEVRIYSPEGGEPRVAEVLFPADFTPARARAWLKVELDEIALQPASVVRCWETLPGGSIRVSMTCERWPTDVESLDLESGIVEYLRGPDTIALDFGVGFTLESASAWLAARTARSDAARTCELRHSLRTVSDSLCSQLRAVFGINLHRRFPSGAEPDAFHFVEVPPPSDTDRRNPADIRAGAGLETDFCNPTEAEAMLAHARSLAEASPQLGFVLTALYPSQVRLLRELAAKALLPDNVAISTPMEIPADGAQALLIGLTRSGTSRAVSFGETPELLLRLVTLAKHRLILFGDPATLICRSRWDRPLDGLDASAADREHRWVTGLVERFPNPADR